MIVYESEAIDEVRRLGSWYRARRPEALERVFARFRETIRRIEENPLGFPLYPGEPDIRRALVPRYPLAIIYLVAQGHVHVIAVAHGRRREGYWRARAKLLP